MSKNKILSTVLTLCDIAMLKINKHKFRLILQKNVMKTSTDRHFYIRCQKKTHSLSKRPGENFHFDFIHVFCTFKHNTTLSYMCQSQM